MVIWYMSACTCTLYIYVYVDTCVCVCMCAYVLFIFFSFSPFLISERTAQHTSKARVKVNIPF